MASPVSTIRNLGPATESAFARAGIDSAEELRELGADAAYTKLLNAGQRPHFIGYLAIVMGLQGRPWNDCKAAEKAALRKRFDALKNARNETGRFRLEVTLNEIGVIRPKAQPTSSSPEKK